jgi:oligopeptide/dipeptide ABC transporter ATP-binding protein
MSAPTNVAVAKVGFGRRVGTNFHKIFSSWKVTTGVVGMGLIILVGVIGPHVAPFNPNATSSATLEAPSLSHWFGTTLSGQDVLSQFLVGAGPSLLVGFVAAAFSTVLSLVFGLLSAYLRGVIAELLSLVSNVFLVIPTLPLLIVVGAYLPSTNYVLLAFVIGLTSWAWGARVIRAQALSLKSRDYILAAQATGESTWRVLVYELLPGLIPVIAASFLFTVTYAILTEAGLAFLGIGDLTKWTWGTMLYWTQNDGAFLQGAWWWYVPPGLAIALVGFFLAFINFGIDEHVNSRLRMTSKIKKRRVLRHFRNRVFGAKSSSVLSGTHGAIGTDEVADSTDDVVLSTEGLSVLFGTQKPIIAVDDVSFSVRRGEIFGIAGESGCGKTTLLNTIARILPRGADVIDGEIVLRPKNGPEVDILKVKGEDLRKIRWSKIAIVTQASMNASNPVITVERQLLDVLKAHDFGKSRRDRVARARELMVLVGISPDRLKSFPHQLSGGMRQRVMIAMSLALEPDLLLLDEPTTALDVVTQRQIVDEVLRIRDRMGISIVFVTHDLSLLIETADRVAIMYAGKIVEIATCDQLRIAASHPYTKALLVSMPTIEGRPGDAEQLQGSPPDMRALPTGCRFQSRCKYADEVCVEQEPLLRPVHEEDETVQMVACHIGDPRVVMDRPLRLSALSTEEVNV